MKTIVVALGGNAILQAKQQGTAAEQRANVAYSAQQIVKLMAAGHRVVVVHGNGPQVGNILLQNAAARDQVPAMPLDICGAQSQGLIGYMIQQCLLNELRQAQLEQPVVTVLTQVAVDPGDAAFQNPTKPVGPFYGREEAKRNMQTKGETWTEDSGRGWRKVVPSPRPLQILELATIKALSAQGAVVIAAGGGGIPVAQRDGQWSGVEAVIDKDLAAALLARELGADLLVIATDVNHVALDWGQPTQKDLVSLTVTEGKTYLAQGQFGQGSMGPKVEAALAFVEQGGEAIITSLAAMAAAVAGGGGTRIVADS